MKIYSAQQLRLADAYTIEHEPIASIDLMERASKAIAERIASRWGTEQQIKVFAGPGNNGGDALAVARMLWEKGYKDIEVYLFNINDKMSADCTTNKNRLQMNTKVSLTEITTQFAPPALTANDLVIDGLFGTGLNRPLNKGFASVVKYINSSVATIVSIDMPSGLMCEDNSYNVMNHIVKAHYTYTFQFPKLAFFFPENECYVGEWEVLDIGVKPPTDNEDMETPYNMTEQNDVLAMLHKRSRFVHKGTMGHAALVAGKRGMSGAAVLAARACMRSGAGKLTVRTPESNVLPLQIGIPEAIISVDPDSKHFSQSFEAADYSAIAIGPGIGTDTQTAQALIEQVNLSKCPIILDADALNILGHHRGWINQLPRNTILTPHKKELFGLISSTRNSFEELQRTRELCVKQQVCIIIKGAFSAVCVPDGSVYFNPTGNSGMATAGCGDVLTGIILGLSAQGYQAEIAARLGVYLHGLSGDLVKQEIGEDSLVASDIINNLGKAFCHIRNSI